MACHLPSPFSPACADLVAVLNSLHSLGFAMTGLTLMRAVQMYVDFDAGKELLSWLLGKKCPAGPVSVTVLGS